SLLCLLCCGRRRAERRGLYSLSLHDALPILASFGADVAVDDTGLGFAVAPTGYEARTYAVEADASAAAYFFAAAAICGGGKEVRSEEHTSELQSHLNLVCRLLLEKKKTQPTP